MKQLNDLKNDEEQYEQKIASLQRDIKKMKELDVSSDFMNRPSQFPFEGGVQNNLMKQLKMTTEFPSIFNPRISLLRNTISRVSRLTKMQSFTKESEDTKKFERSEFGAKKADIFPERIPENLEEEKKVEKEAKDFTTPTVEYKYLMFDEARLKIFLNGTGINTFCLMITACLRMTSWESGRTRSL